MLKYSKNSGASKGHQKYKNGSVNGERGGVVGKIMCLAPKLKWLE